MGVGLQGFEEFVFGHAGKRRRVFRAGDGPAVVIMHELTGLTTETLKFGRRVADAGMTAFLPLFFGEPEKLSPLGTARNTAVICISREFYLFAKRRTSPVTGWLRALCRHAHGECGGPGVGAVGLCLTGGFALALFADESVIAPVMSQPSLPLPLTRGHRCALGLSVEDLAEVRRRTRLGEPVMGLRFSDDRLSPPERFQTLREMLGDAFKGCEIDSSPGNRHGLPANAHSVLTSTGFWTKVQEDATVRVVRFLRESLFSKPEGDGTA